MTHLAVVTAVTPVLRVRGDLSVTDDPAVNMSSVALVIDDRVDVEQVGKQLHVIGVDRSSVAGEVIFGVWAVAPPGTLDCDGATYLRTDHPALSAALGGGGTTFTVPNMPAGTFPASGTPGTSGGAATHTLTTAEMPSHNHTQDAHAHTQNLGGAISTVANVAGSYVVGDANNSTTASTTATNQASGGGGSFPTVPPFAGFRFVIKT